MCLLENLKLETQLTLYSHRTVLDHITGAGGFAAWGFFLNLTPSTPSKSFLWGQTSESIFSFLFHLLQLFTHLLKHSGLSILTTLIRSERPWCMSRLSLSPDTSCFSSHSLFLHIGPHWCFLKNVSPDNKFLTRSKLQWEQQKIIIRT